MVEFKYFPNRMKCSCCKAKLKNMYKNPESDNKWRCNFCYTHCPGDVIYTGCNKVKQRQ